MRQSRACAMAFFKSLPKNAGPPQVFEAHPDLYGLWSEMSQVLMNGTSPLSPGERELILAFAADVAQYEFVCVAHSAVASNGVWRRVSSSDLSRTWTRH